MIILELMQYGDLKWFLEENRWLQARLGINKYG